MEEVMITPFGDYACDWLTIIILRGGEHLLHMLFTPNPFLATGEIKDKQAST